MAGIHRLDHIQRFLTSDLANYDPVRPHAEGVPNQVTLSDGSSAFDIWRAGFEADDMVLL